MCVRCSFWRFLPFKACFTLLFLSQITVTVSIPACLSLLLSGYALNRQTGHGRGRDLGTRSIFSLPRVVRSINVQYLPHPHRDTSPLSIVLIRFRIPTSNLRKAMIPKYLGSYYITGDKWGMKK